MIINFNFIKTRGQGGASAAMSGIGVLNQILAKLFAPVQNKSFIGKPKKRCDFPLASCQKNGWRQRKLSPI